MKTKQTLRGFNIIEFIDLYGMSCSLQESSRAEPDCIWLGINKHRMHLTQEFVRKLLPYLEKFVKTGELK